MSLDRALEPALPALLAVLDVPVEDPQWTRLDPPQRRQRTLDAVKGLLLRESHVQPLVVIFEDLHWIDGETQAVLDGLGEPADGADATARQLPSGVPTRLGQQDFLSASATRRPALRERRGTPRGAAWE